MVDASETNGVEFHQNQDVPKQIGMEYCFFDIFGGGRWCLSLPSQLHPQSFLEDGQKLICT